MLGHGMNRRSMEEKSLLDIEFKKNITETLIFPILHRVGSSVHRVVTE